MTEPYAVRIPLVVRAELARHGVSQTDIAEVLGVSQAAVSRRLSGRVEFTLDELRLIAERLGVPLSTFVPEIAVDAAKGVA
jgi:transcriptional regulator with XRE-family HTH domain